MSRGSLIVESDLPPPHPAGSLLGRGPERRVAAMGKQGLWRSVREDHILAAAGIWWYNLDW